MDGTFTLERTLADLDATGALAARIAAGLRRGDTVALSGDLGAGKTALARAILRHLGVIEDVPSPTFALMQRYDTRAMPVAHYDFYRLEREADVDELGLEESLDEGAAIIEWPERAASRLDAGALHVSLRLEGGVRHARISGPARWRAAFRDRRDGARH